MHLKVIPLDAIRTGGRLRPALPERIAMLAESIEAIGLLQPIAVAPDKWSEGVRMVSGYRLVAGPHRLEAMRRLGHGEIPAIVADMKDLKRQLAEIDENLIRAELTELQRADHLMRRKDVYEGLYPETRQHVAGAHATNGAASDKLSFAADTAAKLGVDKRTIQRFIRRAERLDAIVREKIAPTPIANSGVELDALASLVPADQRRALGLVEQGKADSIRNAVARMRQSKKRAAGSTARLELFKHLKGGLAQLAQLPAPRQVLESVSAVERDIVHQEVRKVRAWLEKLERECAKAAREPHGS